MKTPDLPILSKKEEILQAVRENQVVVLLGPTGSGKTTMTPCFLLEAGYGELGVIGVTEPRRIAVTSLTPYVSALLPENQQHVVAGQTRFWNTATEKTKIKFMTDGILLEEMLYDPELLRYSVLMIDEAHERGVNVDFILGLLKRMLRARPEFRVIIASATIDAGKFSDFFGGAPIVEIEGRMYPVEIRYHARPHFEEGKIERNPARELAQTAIQLHRENKDEGGMLLFNVGKNEIADCMKILRQSKIPDMEVIPVYGHMDLWEQNEVFKPCPGKRKIAIATNVAETSITVPYMKYVVDSGLIKHMNFHAKYGRHSLDVVPHSKSGCDQRAGRVGRMQNGICIRLYTKEEYEALPLYTEPEILRMGLANIILVMRYLGIEDVENFEFIDKPKHGLFREAIQALKVFGALDKNEVLTEHGKRMAILPLDAYLSHMLLSAEKFGCVQEMATVASFISASHVMLRPPEMEKAADSAHLCFESPLSDALTYLNIWGGYQKHEGDSDWCERFFLNEQALIEVRDIRKQILEVLEGFKIKLTSTTDRKQVLAAVGSSLVNNLFRRTERGNAYYPVVRTEADPIFIHPGSSTYDERPEYIVCAEIVRTTKMYGRMCSAVDPKTLKSIFPKGIPCGEPKREEQSKTKSKNGRNKAPEAKTSERKPKRRHSGPKRSRRSR